MRVCLCVCVCARVLAIRDVIVVVQPAVQQLQGHSLSKDGHVLLHKVQVHSSGEIVHHLANEHTAVRAIFLCGQPELSLASLAVRSGGLQACDDRLVRTPVVPKEFLLVRWKEKTQDVLCVCLSSWHFESVSWSLCGACMYVQWAWMTASANASVRVLATTLIEPKKSRTRANYRTSFPADPR